MLLLLIPITWLAVVALFVALCVAAARGDRMYTVASYPEQRPVRAAFQPPGPAPAPTLRSAGV